MSKPALDGEKVVPLLPIIYVAWADGVLSELELAAAMKELARHDVPTEMREAAHAWLDPKSPPTATELAEMLHIVRQRAGSLADEDRKSLADLGHGLAVQRGHEPSASELTALSSLEAALGVGSSEAAHELAGAPTHSADPQSSLPVSRLRVLLDGERAPWRNRVRELAARLGPAPLGASMEEHRARTTGNLAALVESGISAAAYPGVTSDATDMGDFIAAFETLAMGDISLLVKMGVQFGLFGGSIFFLGTDEQRAKYLPQVARGELLGCFAMTEAGHGSNVMGLATTARYLPESDELEIHTPEEGAHKDYIGNAARDAQLATVFAQLEVGGREFGVHAILVPVRDAEGQAMPGVTIGDDGAKMGLGGVDNGRLWFNNVRVPRDHLLGRFASLDEHGNYQSDIASPNKRFFTMLSTLVGGRVSVAAAAGTAAKTGLAIAIRYGELRRQFGPGGEGEIPILDYLSHQRRLLPRLASTYAIHFATRHLADRFVAKTEDDAREIETLAAGLKAYATWHTTDTLQVCRECCGGQGYISENRLDELKNDTDVFTTFEGDNTVLLLLVAKSLLGGFKAQFSDSRVFSMLRFVSQRAASEISEKNPFQIRRTSEEHLRDRSFQLAAFRYREQELTRTAAMRMKTRLDRGVSAFRAQIEVQDHLLAAANAHVERVVLEQFAQAVESAPVEVQPALSRLCDLYALARLDAGSSWFLAEGYMEASKAKSIRALVNQLCSEVRPDAVPLVDAFGIPDSLLPAIAFSATPRRR